MNRWRDWRNQSARDSARRLDKHYIPARQRCRQSARGQQDQLSFHLATGHQRERLGGALERERRGDVRLDPAVEKPPPQLAHRFGKPLRLAARELAPEDADDRTSFEEREVQWNLRNLAGRETDDEQAAPPGERSQRRFGMRAA